MACELTIHAPRGEETPPGQGITTLVVSGTANECTSVRVLVHQTQPVNVTTPQKTVPVTNGAWSVEFTVAAGDFPAGTFLCGRGNKYEIRAECADDDECERVFSDDRIDCGTCPDVTLTITPGDCVNGRRTVHLRAEVDSATDAMYVWYFGTDEDNQQGEDHQAGDGSGDVWLPPPDASGARVVETDHVYEPEGDQPQAITVALETMSGPNSVCRAEQDFTLEPCRCDVAVVLQLTNADGQAVPDADCLAPGDYLVQVTEPVGSDVDHAWSLDGMADSGTTGSSYGFSLSSGEEKTVSVAVEIGGCSASNGVTVRACEDCSDFETELSILDSGRNDVTNDDCLQPGDYTVQAVSPVGAGNTFTWSVDNEVDPGAIGSTLQVSLGEADQKIVTLEASRGPCRDVASVVLSTCPPEEEREGDGFIPCLLFKLLALLGLGLVFLGAILLLCPPVAAPFPPNVAVPIGIGLLIGGALLLALGLILWILICRPDECDWFAFSWQALVLLGLVMIYGGFCPACSWLLLGVIPLILGAGAAILWGRNCNVSRCGVLAEWISLFTFVVNVVAILEMILAACIVTTQPVAAGIWALAIAAIQAWLWYEANQNNCIQT